MKQLSILVLLITLPMVMAGQTISDFENLNLPADSFWNAQDTPLGASFQSGNATFPSYFDTSWGGYWTQGWAYSNMTDSGTSGFGNLYSSRAGSGYGGSSNYVIGQQNSMIHLSGAAQGKVVDGCYITNGAYPYFSMKNGDMFAKKFGGVNGTDPDFLKIDIFGYYNGILTEDSVEFYLADYRFTDSNQDYILDTWEWVELSALGNVDSLWFRLSSSDTGPYGINTPLFYCLDDLTTRDLALSAFELDLLPIDIYPNPAAEWIRISIPNDMENAILNVLDMNGRIHLMENLSVGLNHLRVDALVPGAYIVRISSGEKAYQQKLIVR